MPVPVRERVLGPLARVLRDAPAARKAAATARTRGLAHAHRGALRPLLRALATDCHSVIDVGTGLMRSLADSPCPVRIGLDPHLPYLERREVRDAVPVHAGGLQLAELFPRGAVDLVTLIDVIEHFTVADAEELLRQAQSVARRRVVVFTPRGEFPQEDHDPFALGGEEYQRHRSVWEPESFTRLGFSVIVLDGYHGPWNASFVEGFGPDAPPVDALLAFRDLPG